MLSKDRWKTNAGFFVIPLLRQFEKRKIIVKEEMNLVHEGQKLYQIAIYICTSSS
jgi:hypothetical protein